MTVTKPSRTALVSMLVHWNLESIEIIDPRLKAALIKHALHSSPITSPQRAIWPRTDLLILASPLALQDSTVQRFRCNVVLNPIDDDGQICLGEWPVQLSRVWGAVCRAWNEEQLVPVGHGCGAFGDV